MPDSVPDIRAAGAVLWRPGRTGNEVALIHRCRYDDWSFPKGKCEPGEHVLATAVREVNEETGIRVILGRWLGQSRYPSLGRVKRVDFWAARPADPDASSGFIPNDEVDAMDWLPVPAARGRLSYQRDASRLAEFAAGPAVDDGQATIICAHGENLPLLLQAICERLDAAPPAGPPLRKAAWWVLHTAGGALAGAERYRPADTLPGVTPAPPVRSPGRAGRGGAP